ncbi:MAG: hypothetical protein AAF915_13895 [Cyanobacteria bacterium P01_D01_bin.50]
MDNWKIILGAIALGGGIYFALKYRHKIREEVAKWLRDRGLEKSALTEALLVFDTVAGSPGVIRRKLFVTTQETGEQKLSEENFTMDEFKKLYPDMAAEVERRGHASKNILEDIL